MKTFEQLNISSSQLEQHTQEIICDGNLYHRWIKWRDIKIINHTLHSEKNTIDLTNMSSSLVSCYTNQQAPSLFTVVTCTDIMQPQLMKSSGVNYVDGLKLSTAL
jgi:hypothetical protein